MLRNTILCSLAFLALSLPSISEEATPAPTPTLTLPTGEDQAFVTQDGAWCWFSDPRAIYVKDKVVGGFVDGKGTIWAFSYDPKTQKREQFELHAKLDQDDHANPSFMLLPDKRIAAFYSAHGGTTNSPLYYRITKNPEDPTSWEEEQTIKPQIKGPMGNCYTNPALMTAENNRVYLFFRGSDFKPNFVYSDDMKTWSTPQQLITDPEGSSYVRPYLKSANNGKDSIIFGFTDGHPRNEATNSIYFLKYKGGKYLNAKNEVIGSTEKAMLPRDCDVVYDAKKTGDKAWIWDIAFDEKENPVLVYARFAHTTGAHSYWYARWNGSAWENSKITEGGRYFQRPEQPKEKMEYENNYSGGVYLDHENPNIVYTSRPINDVFEIEQWTTADGGKKWTSKPITKDSHKDNVRPFVIRNHPKTEDNTVLWMYNYRYPAFRDYTCALRINAEAQPASSALTQESITSIANKVAHWEMENYASLPSAKTPSDWLNGALYLGMNNWAQAVDNKKLEQWLMRHLGGKLGWTPANRLYHADDIAVCQTYLDLYKKHKKPSMLTPSVIRTEWVMNNPSKGSLDCNYSDPTSLERWSWCDALYMAPPVYAQLYALTGDKKYMEFADKEFKATTDYLYDKDESLYYRDSRYFPDKKKEANGQKVFWGRGNGWVIAGLAKILDTLPKDDKTYRPYYEEIFTSMAKRLAKLQGKDGYWHASLLDPESFPNPETSATGFIVYGLAYAINNGYLPKEEYLPIVEKGWDALVRSVNTEGKLGWVQPVGADPKGVKKSNNEVYGVGAFLQAATEMLKLVPKN